MAQVPLALGEVIPSAKRFLVEILRSGHPGPGLWLSFEEHSGWLVAGVADPGWLADLAPAARQAFGTALAGLYKLAGRPPRPRADRRGPGPRCVARLRLPARGDRRLARPGLGRWGALPAPAPRPGSPPLVPIGRPGLEASEVDPGRLLFADLAIPWRRWVEVWERDRAGEDHPAEFVEGVALLPNVPERTPT